MNFWKLQLGLGCIVAALSCGSGERILTATYSDSILAMVSRYLPSDPVILEAGAADGMDTVCMKKMWPKATIYSFEPVPELYDTLVKRVWGLERVFCYNLALSDKDGTATMFISELVNRPGQAVGSNSLFAPKEHLAKNHDVVFPRVGSVQTMTLNKWAAQNGIEKIDFMWLDAQGMELLILKAAGDLIKKVRALWVEVEFIEAYAGQPLFAEVDAWIKQQGFIRVARDFDRPTARCWSGNCLYVREELQGV